MGYMDDVLVLLHYKTEPFKPRGYLSKCPQLSLPLLLRVDGDGEGVGEIHLGYSTTDLWNCKLVGHSLVGSGDT